MLNSTQDTAEMSLLSLILDHAQSSKEIIRMVHERCTVDKQTADELKDIIGLLQQIQEKDRVILQRYGNPHKNRSTVFTKEEATAALGTKVFVPSSEVTGTVIGMQEDWNGYQLDVDFGDQGIICMLKEDYLRWRKD